MAIATALHGQVATQAEKIPGNAQSQTVAMTGEVVWVQANYVVLTPENGENKEYTVSDSYRFVVEGNPASVHDLRQGMKVTARKIVEEPQTEITVNTVITGKAPK
jgi:hypothetical protein